MLSGIDVSRYQGEINWQQVKDKASFVFIKATEGSGYVDPRLEANWRGAGDVGLARGLYHFFRPKSGDEYKKQADWFWQQVQRFPCEMQPVLDCESNGGLGKATLNTVTKTFITTFESLSEQAMMIYTNPGFFNSNMPLTDWAWKRRLWVAHYTSAAQPILPNEWKDRGQSWVFWQYSATNNMMGDDYGVSSDDLDLNRFNGDASDFEAMFRVNVEVPVPPPLPPAEPLYYEVASPILNVRIGPGVNYPKIGEIVYGTVIAAQAISAPREAWIEISTERWCAFKYNGTQYLNQLN